MEFVFVFGWIWAVCFIASYRIAKTAIIASENGWCFLAAIVIGALCLFAGPIALVFAATMYVVEVKDHRTNAISEWLLKNRVKNTDK